MTQTFHYQTTVRPEWIDYNGHMQDAFYGLVFSHAVDAFQDEVGFDAAYRKDTGCTIYLLEDHKRFLKEVKAGTELGVETYLLDSNVKRMHLWSVMKAGTEMVAVSEMIEMHVQQHPQPHGAPIPEDIQRRLEEARLPNERQVELRFRARSLSIESK